MVFVEIDNFQMEINELGDFSLKDISCYTKFKFKELFKTFNKNFITKRELQDFIRQNENDIDKDFPGMIRSLEKYTWFEIVVDLMGKQDFFNKIDTKFITLWNALENSNEEVMISPVLLEFMGFKMKNNDSASHLIKCKSAFIKFLDNNSILTTEPTQRNKDDLIKSIDKIFLTFDAIKDCVMALESDTARETRKYIIQLEKMHNKYFIDELQNETNDLQLENQRLKRTFYDHQCEINKIKIEKAHLEKQNIKLTVKLRELEFNNKSLEDKKSDLEAMIADRKKKSQRKDGYIYIAVSKTYAKKHIFKVGLTVNLRNRLPTYNTGKVGEDRFYYGYYRWVSNMRYTEENIHSVLQEFRDSTRNEFFKIPFNYLTDTIDSIIDEINQGVEDFAKLKRNKQIEKLLSLRGRIIPEKTIGENGELSELHVIDAISDVLNRYGENGYEVITRNELLSEVTEKLNTQAFNKMDIWRMFKTQYKWKSSKQPIFHGGYEIIVEYFDVNI